MKTRYLLFALLLSTVALYSCEKEDPAPTPAPEPTPTDYYAGLGTTPGTPAGKPYLLPAGISVVGEIRGGLSGKAPYEKNYKGPFNDFPKASYVTLGTGTYVNLYMMLYNSNFTNLSFSLPGGLIFVDSSDVFNHEPVYQKGYILQNVNVSINAFDTAYIQLRAYCLNHTLSPSTYDAVYYFGPVTSNPQLNTITGIMATKAYPFGEEYNIQTIIWNVTDYGLTLTSAEIAYLNGLP